MEVNNSNGGVMYSGNINAAGAPLVEKKKVWPYVVIGVLGVTTLVFAGLFVWALLRDNGDDGGVCDDAVVVEDENVKEVLAEAQKDAEVRKLVAEIETKVEEQVAPFEVSSRFYDSGGLFYQPEGFVTAIELNKSYGFLMDPIEGHTELNNKLQAVDVGRMLEERGFAKFGENYGTASAWGSTVTTYVNEQMGIVCETPAGYVSLNCGATTWYDEVDAKLSNELAKVYNEAVEEDAKLMVATTSAIKNSEVQPYQTILAYLNGFGAMFYRTSPEAEWVYFARGQGAPACAEYNTEDLKKAFLGQLCWSEEDGSDAKVEL